ncbi:MAG TPA: EamA family transporter [Chryseolinea sp.]|nr:EamA family transporter [Chryseolinea sp.]
MNGSVKTQEPAWKIIFAYGIVYVVWGSTYFFIQKALQAFPPLFLGAFRFLVAGLLLLGWNAIRGEKLFVWNDIKHGALTGFLLLFVGNGAVIWVEQYLPSAMVAIIVCSSPIWFVALDRPKWKQNLGSRSTILGLVMGFAGVILLFSEKLSGLSHSANSGKELLGFGMLIIGAMSWAGGSIYSGYRPQRGSASVNTAWQMLVAALAFIPGSLLLGEYSEVKWETISANSWFSVSYLILFGSIAGYSAYVFLIKNQPAAQVSTYAYVNPVVAVLLGVFFANENISLVQILGLGIILVSVLLINLAKYRNAKQAQAAQEREHQLIPAVTQECVTC